MEWLSFPTLFTFAEHLTAPPIEPIHPPSGDKDTDEPEEHECITIYGFFGVPEVSDLTNRGAPIRIIIPRGKIIKRIPFGEVNFAEGPISIEGNICPEYQIGTDIESANIIISLEPQFVTWNLIIGRLPPEVEPPYSEE